MPPKRTPGPMKLRAGNASAAPPPSPLRRGEKRVWWNSSGKRGVGKLSDLNSDCFSVVLSFLSVEEVAFRIAALNKSFRAAALADGLWEILALREIPPEALQQHVSVTVDDRGVTRVAPLSPAVRLCVPMMMLQGLDLQQGWTPKRLERAVAATWAAVDRVYCGDHALHDAGAALAAEIQRLFGLDVTPPPLWWCIFNAVAFATHYPAISRFFGDREVGLTAPIHIWDLNRNSLELSRDFSSELFAEDKLDNVVAVMRRGCAVESTPLFQRHLTWLRVVRNITASAMRAEVGNNIFVSRSAPMPDAVFDVISSVAKSVGLREDAIHELFTLGFTGGLTAFVLVIEVIITMSYQATFSPEAAAWFDSGIDEESIYARGWSNALPFRALFAVGAAPFHALSWLLSFAPFSIPWPSASLFYSIPVVGSHRQWAEKRVPFYSFTDHSRWFELAFKTPVNVHFLLQSPTIAAASCIVLLSQLLRFAKCPSYTWLRNANVSMCLLHLVEGPLWQGVSWLILIGAGQQMAKAFRWPIRWLCNYAWFFFVPVSIVWLLIALVRSYEQRLFATGTRLNQRKLWSNLRAPLSMALLGGVGSLAARLLSFHDLFLAFSRSILNVVGLGSITHLTDDAALNLDMLDDIALYGMVGAAFLLATLRTAAVCAPRTDTWNPLDQLDVAKFRFLRKSGIAAARRMVFKAAIEFLDINLPWGPPPSGEKGEGEGSPSGRKAKLRALPGRFVSPLRLVFRAVEVASDGGAVDWLMHLVRAVGPHRLPQLKRRSPLAAITATASLWGRCSDWFTKNVWVVFRGTALDAEAPRYPIVTLAAITFLQHLVIDLSTVVIFIQSGSFLESLVFRVAVGFFLSLTNLAAAFLVR